MNGRMAVNEHLGWMSKEAVLFYKVPHTLCSDKKRTAPQPSLSVTELITSRKRNMCANYSTTTLNTDVYIFRIPWQKHPDDGRNTFFRKFVDFYTTTWHRIPEDITAKAVGPQILRCTSYATFSNYVPARPSTKNGWRQGKVLGSEKVMW